MNQMDEDWVSCLNCEYEYRLEEYSLLFNKCPICESREYEKAYSTYEKRGNAYYE